MPELFAIGDEVTHVIADAQCPECLEETCPCGGLIHAATGEQDGGGNGLAADAM